MQGTIDNLKHEVAESRARLHAQGEIERTLRAQLEATRRELSRACDFSKASENHTLLKSANNAVSDLTSEDYIGYNDEPMNGHSELDELQINSKAELSTDPNELAAEVNIYYENITCLIIVHYY